MPRKRSNTSYTLQALPADLVVAETDALYINFRAESLAAAIAQAMIYVRNEAFLKGIRCVSFCATTQISSPPPVQVDYVDTVAHQAAARDEESVWIDGGHTVPRG